MNRSRSLKDFERAGGTLDERLQGALARIALAARHDFRRQAAAEGLSAVQGQALELLAREGPMEMGAVASSLALTSATVSDSIAALERRGLVTRQPVARDRRRVRVRATAAGRRLGRTLSTWPDLFRESLAGLSEPEKRVLLRTLVRIILSLLERGVIQRARMCVTCAFFRPRVHPRTRRPHHCALADVPLGPASVRLDCPDHQPGPPASEALARLDHWLEGTP